MTRTPLPKNRREHFLGRLFRRLFLALVLVAIGVAGLWVVKIRPALLEARCIDQTREIYAQIGRYHTDYGKFPDGWRRALPLALLGDNLEKMDYLPAIPNHQKDPKTGEIRDCYGTPYRLEVVDGGIRVFSAGPNRIAGDKDDIDEFSFIRVMQGVDPLARNAPKIEGEIRPNPVGRSLKK